MRDRVACFLAETARPKLQAGFVVTALIGNAVLPGNRSVRMVLEDGTEMTGRAFGALKAVTGEVVFNTAMVGYVEALTDPSYRGQILILTYPLIGNYGVPPARPPESIDGPFESGRIQVQGLIVQHYVGKPSHASSARSLGAWLEEEGVPAVEGIDTRRLTRKLREVGTMKGWLLPAATPDSKARESAESVDMATVHDLVAPRDVVRYGAGDTRILLVDAGAKDNIVRSLLKRDASVLRAGWRRNLVELAGEADGVLFGNGPGDPKDARALIAQVRELIRTDYPKPLFGICLGNQILALAAGADTYKLRYGHRGINQPVQDLMSRRCFVTSQNHGYAVRDASLPSGWEPWFVNLNDGTNEGVRCRSRPYSSIQFHPEAAPGPRDSGVLFDEFLRQIRAMRDR